MNARWYVVMLPGEYAETSELYGPVREEARAVEMADRWNLEHPPQTDSFSDRIDRAVVLPIFPAEALKEAS